MNKKGIPHYSVIYIDAYSADVIDNWDRNTVVRTNISHVNAHQWVKDRTAMDVDDYAQASTCQRGSMTIQARRVLRALLSIGLDRSDFSARTHMEAPGVYGSALGHIKSRQGCALVIKQCDLLVHCGLCVHILNTTEGKESAFVATPRYGSPRVIVYAGVGSADYSAADKEVEVRRA